MLRLVSRRILGAASREVPSPALQVFPRFSHEKAADHFNNPQDVGSFDKNYCNVGMGLAGAPTFGDDMKLHIKGDEKTGKIADACLKTFVCGSAIASSSLAAEWVKGKQIGGVLSTKNTEIAKHPSLYPFKLHCGMFAMDSIKGAAKGYEARRAFATAAEAASGEKAATPPVKNRLRPLSPHLSIYKPQSSSLSSIFNRICGSVLAAMVLSFYLLCLKMPLVCFTYADFYQFFHFSSKFTLIFTEIAALALTYHVYEGVRRLLH